LGIRRTGQENGKGHREIMGEWKERLGWKGNKPSSAWPLLSKS